MFRHEQFGQQLLQEIEHSQGERHHEVACPVMEDFFRNRWIDRIHHAGQGDANRVDGQRDRNGAGQDHQALVPLQIAEHDDRHGERDEDCEHPQPTAGINDAQVHLADNDLVAFPDGINPERLDGVGAHDGGHRLQRAQQIPRGFVWQGIHEDQEGDRCPRPAKHAPATPQQHGTRHGRHEGIHVDGDDSIAGHEQPEG